MILRSLRRYPLWWAFASASLLCLLLGLAFPLWEGLAEWWSRYPAAGLRLALGGISSLAPFSLFELLIALAVLYGLFLLIFTVVLLCRRERRRRFLRFKALYLIPLCVLICVADLFFLTFSSSYHRRSVAESMALETEDLSEEDLFFALETLCAMANEAEAQIPKNEAGESLMPYTEGERAEAVRRAAEAFGKRNPFYQSAGFRTKSLVSSPLITYTHISGIFGFFTGEANVNDHYPHFIVTATAAHESAHARGIGPENECNFLAFATLAESEDPYLAYCGTVFVLDDFISLCRRLDRDRAEGVLESLSPTVWRDWEAYSRFFEPYRDSAAAEIADKTNSAYLKSQGQSEGTLSYSRIIALCTAYLKSAR
ncbi:MAG: DUF3810 domain-containing protein [Clostridia bacterium]|nr:DUF3810 domain-containing protein [Clostridia bacterium]